MTYDKPEKYSRVVTDNYEGPAIKESLWGFYIGPNSIKQLRVDAPPDLMALQNSLRTVVARLGPP